MNREEYMHLNCNDKTVASTHMASEYGALQSDKLKRHKLMYKNQASEGILLNQGYSVLKPCYSDTSTMNISELPINKNNSAIVI